MMTNNTTLPNPSPAITYTGMIWLLAAQLTVMLPFVFELPFWLIVVALFSVAWRLGVLAGRVNQPGNLLKVALMVLGIGGLLLSGLRFPSLEAMSGLLLLGFAFKSLEVLQRRDALVVIFIGYFLIAMQFLYTQSMLAGLYGAFALLVLTGALIGVQQAVTEFSAAHSVRFNLKLAGMMLLQCLPLMLVIFVLAPRLQPLWTLPLMTDQAKTGMSDRMAPGDIAKLSQSDGLAFRVTFKGERPPQSKLYWRGLVLNHFDGREWRQFESEQDLWQLKSLLKNNYAFQPGSLRVMGDPVDYEAIYEKTGQPWLFTLTPSVQVEGDVLRAADFRILAQQNIQAPLLLRATSYPDSLLDVDIAPYIRQLALQLPHDGDTRSRQLAQTLRAAARDELTYMQNVLNRFREQAFYYTLRPPLMGNTDTIDSFLFDAQRGFCEHYAGSFVFMMRAAGIPARVVVGYQGGEWNAASHYLSVHQFDAHAWAEVWLSGRGWVRVDPTAMVAPERTEQGLQAAVQQEGSFLESSVFSSRNIPWLNNLRQQLDAVQYGWQRWVIGYDSTSQTEFLKALLGEMSITRIAALAGAVLAVIMLSWLLMLGLAQRRQQEAPEHRLYRRFCAQLAKQGLVRAPGQTAGSFATEAAHSLPAQSEAIHAFTAAYETLCYTPGYASADTPDRGDKTVLLQKMKSLLRKL